MIEDADNEPRPWLWLEPGALRRHDHSSIRHGHQVINDHRMHGKGCNTVLLAPLLKLLQTTDTPNEVDPLIVSQILDAQDGVQDMIIQELNVQTLNWV